jgi:hypothetical protein
VTAADARQLRAAPGVRLLVGRGRGLRAIADAASLREAPGVIELPEGRRLRAALAAVLVRADAPELRLVHRWVDSWSGIGLIVIGMSH